MRNRLRDSAAIRCVLAAVLALTCTVGSFTVGTGTQPAAGWSYETLRHISFEHPRIQVAGLGFDPQNRPAAGWGEASANGGVNNFRWARRESNVWVENTLTQPGGGIRAAQADFTLRQDGTPFFAYAIRDAYVFGQDWYTAHIVDLGAYPSGHGPSVQPIEAGQSCIAAYPKFAIDFAVGALSPSFLVGTHCLFEGWLAFNNAAIHGAPAFRAPAGTGGEFHSIDYATSFDGSHHVTYFAERGGPDGWGAYYSNGSPGHEVRLAVPHRNRRAETSIAIGPDGRIHVALGGVPLCGNTFEGGLLYLTSTDGINWTKTFVDETSGRSPSLRLDADGQPHIAYWRQETEVRLASLESDVWSTTPVYSATTPVGVTSVKLAFDATDRPHVLFFNPDTRDLSLASGGPSNRAPAVTNPGTQIASVGNPASLQIATVDPEGDDLSFTACNLPPGLTIHPDTGVVSGTIPSGTPVTSFDVTVTVTDTAGNTASAGFNWTISANQAPLMTNPGDRTNTAGDAVVLQLEASDPDGDALFYSAIGLLPGLTIDSATGLISGTLPFTAAGPSTVTVSASDGSRSDSETFVWTVMPGDETAPVTSAISLPAPNANGWNSTDVTAYLTATDPAGGSGVKQITYSINGAPATVVSASSASLPIVAEAITHITYFAEDHAGNVELPQTLTVRIDKKPPVVTIASPADGAVFHTEQSLTVFFAATDDLSGIVSLSASLGGAAVINGQPISLAGLAGTHTLTVMARDRAGNHVSRSVTFTVVLTVPLDIKPTSCPNPLSVGDNGVLPVALVGTANFDVTQVDLASLRLEGISPLRAAWEDVVAPFGPPFTLKSRASDCTQAGADGVGDLSLKFNAQAVIAALGPVTNGEVRIVRVTGRLRPEFGGQPILGVDVVIMRKK